MDTHLTPINETVVREREQAMRTAHERASTTISTPIPTPEDTTAPAEAGAEVRRARGGGDLLVVTLFAVLAAGFVSLVVSTLQV